MGHARTSQVLLVSGFALLIFSFSWPSIVGGKRAYTDEDAEEHQAATSTLHSLEGQFASQKEKEGAGHHHHHGEKSHVTEEELKAARDRENASLAKRDEALTRGQTTALVTKWLSLIVLAAGLVFHYMHKREEE